MAKTQRKNPEWERPARDHVEIEPTAVRGELPDMLTRTMTASGAFDADAMTITAVVATDTPVMRRDARGLYSEVLDPAGVDLSVEDVPLLDTHNSRTVRATLGRAFNFRREGNAILADLRFSTAPDVEPIVHRVRDGTTPNFSIGYRVARWLESTVAGRVRTAAAWAITEVSLVSQPADPKAKKRSIEMEEELIMPEEQATAIRSLGEHMDFPPSWAEEQIEANATVADARAAAREEVVRRSQTTPRVRVTGSNEDPAVIVRRQTDALVYRAAGGELPDDARQYVEMSFRDLMVDSIQRAGGSTRGMSADGIIERALGTSDFPLTVSNAANKIALDRFNAAASGIMPLVRQRNLKDFKPSHAIRHGELGELKPLNEHGEIQHTARAENGEVMQLATSAGALDLTRAMLINDDANLFGDMTAALADAAAATVSNKLAGLLIDSHNLSDGQNVFHASRGNLAGTGTGIDVAALDAARKAMRVVKGLNGETIVGAAPRYLVVGPETETEAEQVLADIYAATPDHVNPFSKRLQLLVEPRIEDGRWFVFADPARLPCLQMAYLSGAPGPQIQRAEAWTTLGMKFRCFLDFGCGWTDWRGAYKNAGE